MTFEILSLLIVIGVAMVLFSFEHFPADVIALGVLFVLIVLGLVPFDQAFLGFGSDTFVMILGLLVLTAALVQTGVVDLASQAILHRVGEKPRTLSIMIMAAASVLSAFMSNTGATAFFLPVTIDLSHRMKVSVSKLLMPLAFASILASSVTLIGTSTNIVISGLITDYGMAPLGMFELTMVGLPVLIVGLVYMVVVGIRWIPDRHAEEGASEDFGIQSYLTEVIVLPDSPLVGKPLAESGLGKDLGLTVLRVLRDRRRYLAPQAEMKLKGNDLLLVEGARDEIIHIRKELGFELKPRMEIAKKELESNDVGLFEVIVLPRSPVIGRTLEQIGFRERYGLQVLGVNRHGHTVHNKLSQVRLYTGDQLLVQGNRANLKVLDQENTLRLIRPVDARLPSNRLAGLATGIFILTIALAALNVFSLPVAVVLGVLLAFITRTITPEEAYRKVEWRALILIGCMLAVGAAMEHTGTAGYLAGQIVKLTRDLHPIWLLSSFFGLTMLLTQPMSNQAAAVVVIPVAIQTAVQLGLNPRTFAVMIAVGASCSFLTPLEPACLMVYGPGNYRWIDFLKVGSLLTVLVYLVAILLVPIIWPL